MRLSRSSILLPLAIAGILAAAVVVPRLWSDPRRLVVYCAHDAALADGVIRRFTQQTGIEVDVRYDEEANKSLGLMNLLLAERNSPRADVFWNNQLLGTVRLQREGVLQPYRGRGWERIPEAFRDPQGYWTGFAARLRVWIINTDRMSVQQDQIQQRMESGALQDAAIAEPLFGTTLSHYCVLAEQWGLDRLQRWHRQIRERGMREVRGNSVVKDLVADGVCAFGLTDTDDAFAAQDDGAAVAMLPVRLQDGATICIPNSVAMLAGCDHPDAARQFIDFVLTAETELQLARGAGRQIPLGPVDRSQLPQELRTLTQWAADGIRLAPAAEYHNQVQRWLAAESTGQ